MKRVADLAKDVRAAAVLEFAFAAPILIMLLIGISQLGLAFYAGAGLKHGVAEGARLATIFPRPSDATIVSKINSESFGLSRGTITGPTIANCTSSGYECLDINMSYQVQLDFAFINLPPMTVTENRRVFVNPAS
jgi:Flp pilus assembly protein TadG